jgi:hypothetical protein
MKTKVLIFLALILLAVVGCNNFYHDLLPSDDNFIKRFEFEGQVGTTQINREIINAAAEKGTNLRLVVPRVSVSDRASVIPVTLDYVKAAFPDINLLKTAVELYTTKDITAYMTNLIKETPDFNVPALDIPIDFSGPVTFLVISARGNIRQYTATIGIDSGEPEILNFRFSKYDNPELIGDTAGRLTAADHRITARAVYPAEMDSLSYALIPSFYILGDSLEVDGVEMVSGTTPLQFEQMTGLQSKTMTVWRDGESVDYVLDVYFSEDPDSIRSITDFRFTKNDNDDIAANAVASIFNTDNTGTITVQVYYSGVKPSTLIPRFITPGTVSVAGVPQTSGVSVHDFSAPLQYRVVSRSGQYARLYTVRVDFIDVTLDEPRITAFKFSQNLNAELVQDTAAEISDGHIVIDAYYGGLTAPETLIPEFSAQGIVTVAGSVQISGASEQDFSRQIKYTVTNPEMPDLQRDYWVQARIVQDASSNAIITAFGLYCEDNPSLELEEDIDAKVNQAAGKITVIAPLGSGAKVQTVFPRFEAVGQVSVNGFVQSSGSSPQIFEVPITYTVVSANGKNSRSYTVEIRELRSPMLVNSNAAGMGDGTSWENAFLNLQAACEAAALFPDAALKEIWIAAGTYTPGETADDYFMLTPNTSYIGGFAGHETAKNQRNVAANETIISGDLGGGRHSYHLFAPAFDAANNALVTDGDIAFENLVFSDAQAVREGTGIRGRQGAAILAQLSEEGNIAIKGCTFRDLTAVGGGRHYFLGQGPGAETEWYFAPSSLVGGSTGVAIYVQDGNALVSDTAFYACGFAIPSTVVEFIRYYRGHGIAYIDCNGTITVQNVSVQDSNAGLSLKSFGDITVDSLNLRNIDTIGFHVEGRTLGENTTVTANHTFSNITANNVGFYGGLYSNSINNMAVYVVRGSGFTLRDSVFDSCGSIWLTTQRRIIYVINTVIRDTLPNAYYGVAMYVSCGIVNLSGTFNGFAVFDRLTIDGAEEGLQLELVGGSSTAQIYNSTIRNCPGSSASRAGINVYGDTGSDIVEIVNNTLENLISSASPNIIRASYCKVRFRPNNRYNGTLLTESAIQSMVTADTIYIGTNASWEMQ